MSFFENARNITISGTSFNVVNGGMEVFDHSRHEANVDSFNTRNDTTVDSYNDNSQRHGGAGHPEPMLSSPPPQNRPRSAEGIYGPPQHFAPDYHGDPSQHGERGDASAYGDPWNHGPSQPSPWMYGQAYPYPVPPPQMYPYHQYGYPPPGVPFHPSPHLGYPEFPEGQNDPRMSEDLGNAMYQGERERYQERRTKKKGKSSRDHRKKEENVLKSQSSEALTHEMAEVVLVDESRPEFSRVKSDPQNPMPVAPTNDNLTTSGASNVSTSLVASTELPARTPSPSPKKKEKSSKTSTSSKWLELGAEGGTLLLTLVQQAAQLAPIPYLQLAASTTLKIVNTVQAVKGNKAEFQRLAQDSTELIAVVWRSYQKAPDPEAWSREKIDMVESLVTTLHMILGFVEEQVGRNVAVRVIFSVADAGKIKELRERLQTAIDKFEVAAHLSVQDMLSEILKGQKEILARLNQHDR